MYQNIHLAKSTTTLTYGYKHFKREQIEKKKREHKRISSWNENVKNAK